MLEIRPNCECCDSDLSANSEEARICSYECTFCRECVETVLNNVCPNCGGGLVPRPIRPETEYRKGVSLKHQTASNVRVNTTYSVEEIKAFSGSLKRIAPKNR